MFDRIGPYHFARLRTIGKLISTVAIEMTAMDKTYDWDPVDGAENFQRGTLFDSGDPVLGSSVEVRRQVHASHWRSAAPRVVAVPGWSDRRALSALRMVRQQRAFRRS